MLIEKAFTKVLGNYMKADVGGFMQGGIRIMTGVPVFSYSFSSNVDMNTVF